MCDVVGNQLSAIHRPPAEKGRERAKKECGPGSCGRTGCEEPSRVVVVGSERK